MNDLIWPEDSLTDNGLHVFSTGIRASDKMKAIKIDRKEPNKKQEVTLNDGEDDLGPPVTDDINELLGSLCGHDHRRNAFLELRHKKQNIRHEK